ncbi:MAG: aldose 1-epimerase [Actinomycetota bacterium]|nr:aldose 1-epimerase [Actinomycetota bacterium]
MTVTPTGEQYEIAHGDQRAVVVQVGGALRSYDVAGRHVVDGFAAGARPDGGRGQLLAPWPNRIRDGRYRWGDTDQQLALSEAVSRNAIHGLVRWSEWSLLGGSDSSVTVGIRLWPQPGYPFRIDLAATYRLAHDGLSVTIIGRNVGTEAAPYGVGQHPYVTAGTDHIDDAVLTVPADQWLRCDDRGLPVATEPVAGTPYDFRAPRAISQTALDTPYAALSRDADGRVVVRLDSPDGAHGVGVWLGEGAEFLQLFSGDKLAPPRRRTGLAVEPMSCPPDAFNSGVGLVALQPGARHTLRWGIFTR